MYRPSFLHWPLLCAALMMLSPGAPSHAEDFAEFELPPVQLPSIPNQEVSIAEFGAVPDGRTLNTEAFARAIETLVDRGGGRLMVPAGLWKCGPIELRSRIDLHLQEGALLLFDGDPERYGDPDRIVRGLIRGVDLADVVISGRGVIEGAGDAWRPVKRFKMTDRQWDALQDRGGVLTNDGEIWWPSETHTRIRRPRLVRLDDCRRVLIENATFRNSPSFSLDLADCEDVTIRNVNVLNFWYAQNGDGIDLHSCRNVHIRGARVDVGDDALCMKSNRGRPLENVLIENCVVYHGHGGFVTGSEEVGGMRNIRVRDCTFIGTDVGLRFKSARDRGGLVTDIDIRNIRMLDIANEAILFDMHYQDDLPIDDQGMVTRAADSEAPAVTDTTPRFRNISIRDVICRGAERAVLLAGLPEMPVQNIRLENVSITARTGMICMDARDISLKNMELLSDQGPALHFYNAQQVTLDGLRHGEGLVQPVRVQGAQNEGLVFSASTPTNAVLFVDGAPPAAAAFD